MKRSWIGFGLLLILLAAGIFSAWIMVEIHDPVERDLNQAAQCAMLGDWINADFFFRRAKDQWDRWEHLRSCLADHTPVEEVDGEFALLEVYCFIQEDAAFTAGCRELARKAAAVGEAHEFVWWNLV